MKHLLFVLLFAFAGTASPGELTMCTGEYALCAASTCKPTGKTITGSNGIAYPEVICKCPILNGAAIADTSAGNMTGSCLATSMSGVYLLLRYFIHKKPATLARKLEI